MNDQPPRRRTRSRVLMSLITVGSLTLIIELTSLFGLSNDGLLGLRRWHNSFNYKLSPEETVSDADLLHLSLLQETCVADPNALLPWQFGSPDDQLGDGTAKNIHVLLHKSDNELLQKLRHCPDIDIFLPTTARTDGYCQDAAAYVKYLESRLLPEWVLEMQLFDPDLGRTISYFDLCPTTPMVFLDHLWGGFPNSPHWPKDKPVYMMPNIETTTITPTHFVWSDVVLCKTQECYKRVTKWYEQEGNPRNTTVVYTKHTSSSPQVCARKRLGEHVIASKDYTNLRFLHTAGNSSLKGTSEVLDCWEHTADLPPLDVYIDDTPYQRLFPVSDGVIDRLSPVNIHLGVQKRVDYCKIVAEASFIVNPSYCEGYGHLINEARATGAVIVTTDLPPMNELIIANESGVLVTVEREKHPMVMLGGKYRGRKGLEKVEGLLASFLGSDVCEAIQHVVKSFTPEERAHLGFNAYRQYHADTKYFARAMQTLREFSQKVNL